MDMFKWNQPLKRKGQVVLRNESSSTFLFCLVLVDSWQREQEPKKRKVSKKWETRSENQYPSEFLGTGRVKPWVSPTITKSVKNVSKDCKRVFPLFKGQQCSSWMGQLQKSFWLQPNLRRIPNFKPPETKTRSNRKLYWCGVCQELENCASNFWLQKLRA